MSSLDSVRPKLRVFVIENDGEVLDTVPIINSTTSTGTEASDSSDAKCRSFVNASPPGVMDARKAIRHVPPMSNTQSVVDGSAVGDLSRCSSIDSDTITFTNMAVDWAHVEEFHQPLSPSIMLSPSCVGNQSAMDGAVSSTMERVAQLHSFLSESSRSSGGRGSGGEKFMREHQNGANIRRVGSQAEESVGQVSAGSDDSMNREETQLKDAAEEMKREMECVDRLLLMPVHSLSTQHLPCDDTDVCSTSTNVDSLVFDPLDLDEPSGVNKTDSIEYDKASPYGVAEIRDDDCILRESKAYGWDVADHSISTRSRQSLVPNSLLHKFDAVSTTCSSMVTNGSFLSGQQLASPEQVQGRYRYEYETISTKKESSSTLEGGLFVTASVAYVFSVWLRRTDHINVTEEQFFAALTVLPPLVTLLEKKMPHRFEETSLALGIFVGGMLMQHLA
mmetsp:Transcript_14762/g.29817  ORF Transcript_14762/g.29817 Transcript_14762/m.29817 type:complete len:448 (+) Transcript_14762:311-1654(+)|eukprot:CAMPEP_0178537084 /NCGR_PEP_ID=MMETSP0696-20121128/36414_1 /TAXON_ID=265572 /ORGANISM="Extubocellulus spinifer, Strain CCMP396" /LENGTH=447 /DNA_ID=CAMNT_0020169315 /DNA_START=168 /DNA_END=1511 /DNA_ORIENTATION=+